MKKIALCSLMVLVSSAALASILDEKPTLWFRADKGVEVNAAGEVTVWHNQGTMGVAADVKLAVSDSVSSLKVNTAGIGDKPSITFDGKAYLKSASTCKLGAADGCTWVAVYKAAEDFGNVDNMSLFGVTAGSGRFGAFYPAVNKNGVRCYLNSFGYVDAPVTTSPSILITSRTKVDNGYSTETWIDGNRQGAHSTAPVAAWDATFFIGYFGYDWTPPFIGEFAELRIYDKALTSEERAELETSLSEYYGIPIGDKSVFGSMIRGVPADQKYAKIEWTRPLCKENGAYIGWPTIARRKNGELLAVFSGDREGHICPWGKVQMVRSSDNGETWSSPETIVNSPLDDRDSGIMELANGDLVVTWFTSMYFTRLGNATYNRHAAKIKHQDRISELGHFTMRSTDGGVTWEKPVYTEGSTPHGGIQLKDGRLMMVGRAEGTGYKAQMVADDPRYNNLKDELLLEVSTDNAKSWEVAHVFDIPSELNIANIWEPTIAELPSGKLVAMIRQEAGQVIYQTESTDGGKTWTTLHKTPLVGLPPHLLTLKDGRLLCTYCCRLDGRLAIWACVSDDEGATWDASKEFKLCTHWEIDMGYSSSVQLDDGSIITAYYMRDTSAEGCCLMGTKWRLK